MLLASPRREALPSDASADLTWILKSAPALQAVLPLARSPRDRRLRACLARTAAAAKQTSPMAYPARAPSPAPQSSATDGHRASESEVSASPGRTSTTRASLAAWGSSVRPRHHSLHRCHVHILTHLACHVRGQSRGCADLGLDPCQRPPRTH